MQQQQTTAFTSQRQTALDPLAFAGDGTTREQIELIKRTVAKGTTDDELALFLSTASRMRLDPLMKQIHAVKRYSKRENRDVMSIQVGIDGFRVAAIRSGKLDGEEGPFWCGKDGIWRDVWLDDAPPAAAKFVVYRKDCSKPFVAVARYRSYVQIDRDGKPNPMWSRGDDFMLAKCAEAIGKRRAFPDELGGVIAPEEAGTEDEAPDYHPLQALPAAPKSESSYALTEDAQRQARAERRDPMPTQGPGSAAGMVGDNDARERFVSGEIIDTTATTKPEPPKSEPLTDDDVYLIAQDMEKAPEESALNAIGADIGKMDGKEGRRLINESQRKYLNGVFRKRREALRGVKK